MKNIDFSQFQNTWHVEKIIDSICQYKAMFGRPPRYDVPTYNDKKEERPLSRIMRERILSVLQAYDKFVHSDFNSFSLGFLVSENFAKDKKEEVETILKEVLPKNILEDYNIAEMLDNYNKRAALLSCLLDYKIFLTRLNLYWSNYLECDDATYIAMLTTEKLYSKNLNQINTRLNRIIVLLLGDDYENTYSEEELIKKYNYPPITDKELQNMDIDWL